MAINFHRKAKRLITTYKSSWTFGLYKGVWYESSRVDLMTFFHVFDFLFVEFRSKIRPKFFTGYGNRRGCITNNKILFQRWPPRQRRRRRRSEKRVMKKFCHDLFWFFFYFDFFPSRFVSNFFSFLASSCLAVVVSRCHIFVLSSSSAPPSIHPFNKNFFLDCCCALISVHGQGERERERVRASERARIN